MMEFARIVASAAIVGVVGIIFFAIAYVVAAVGQFFDSETIGWLLMILLMFAGLTACVYWWVFV